MKQEVQKGKLQRSVETSEPPSDHLDGSAASPAGRVMERSIRSVIVNLGGVRVSLRTDKDEVYLKRLSDEVNDSINVLRKSSPSASIQQILSLLCIQLADKLRASEEVLEGLRYEILERTDFMLGLLEEEGEGDYP